MSLNITQVKASNPPLTAGCYRFFDAAGQIIYIGKAVNLKSRLLSYWQRSAVLSPAKQQMMSEIARLDWLPVDTEIEALLLEANLVKKHQPRYNVLLRDDKRFTYIKVSLEDELPRVYATRHLDKSGHYFGPFVSATAVKETLKTIRRIWPYCNTGKISDQPCFYYQIGRCAGACGHVISRDQYLRQVIRPIIAFLEGKKGKLIAQLERRQASLVKRQEVEAAAKAAWQLSNMKAVLAGSRVLSVGDKYENDTVELAKLLKLAKVPERIEGYDLSTVFGHQSVGVMVVFAGGEADKDQYRKFKIKQGGLGDTDMLAEVLERRLAHEEWPLPDLMIIDGGKAQLNTAVRILRRQHCVVEVMAISKGEGLRSSQAPDKLFFPGQARPLELPLASPALHLVKRVRDEAHRFAIGYHRDLRSREFLR